MPEAAPVALAGLHILVAEDEYMIAEEIARLLEDAGASPLGPVSSIAEAFEIIASGCRIDAALLDVNLRGEEAWPLVDELKRRQVPTLLSTGYDVEAIQKAYADIPRCEKPASGRDIKQALVRVVASKKSAGGTEPVPPNPPSTFIGKVAA